jgi:eukaryotic-like serine/threonine-protein kinase
MISIPEKYISLGCRCNMVWSIGQVLKDGRYTIEKVAGSGRLSVTYVVRNRQDERVVLKVPSDEVIMGDDFERLQERFVREAFQLQKCRHAHIVKVFDPFQEKGVWCIPMEYIAGTTLAQRDRPQLSETEALTYVRQVGEALGVLHEVGLIHRDVNPGNVMLRIREGRSEAVLIDFGLAKDFTTTHNYVTTQTQIEELLPSYRAPELYTPAGDRGPHCDLYALGALLYELVIGSPPPNVSVRRSSKEALSFPGDVSDRVVKAVEAAMAMKVSDRPASVASWLSGIESGSFVVPVSTPEKPPKPETKWNWTTAIKVMGAVAALLTALTGAISAINPTPKAAENITK